MAAQKKSTSSGNSTTFSRSEASWSTTTVLLSTVTDFLLCALPPCMRPVAESEWSKEGSPHSKCFRGHQI